VLDGELADVRSFGGGVFQVDCCDAREEELVRMFSKFAAVVSWVVGLRC
jgi:hypothetical protein